MGMEGTKDGKWGFVRGRSAYVEAEYGERKEPHDARHEEKAKLQLPY
jgi:hypothetical protein